MLGPARFGDICRWHGAAGCSYGYQACKVPWHQLPSVFQLFAVSDALHYTGPRATGTLPRLPSPLLGAYHRQEQVPWLHVLKASCAVNTVALGGVQASNNGLCSVLPFDGANNGGFRYTRYGQHERAARIDRIRESKTGVTAKILLQYHYERNRPAAHAS
jgi:hypothetical protein